MHKKINLSYCIRDISDGDAIMQIIWSAEGYIQTIGYSSNQSRSRGNLRGQNTGGEKDPGIKNS